MGAKIEVPTIDGRALLKIPPGTQSGQKLRLREKGVPSATKEGVRGDEIVEITVTVPMPRDERTKELLRELAKLNPEDPRAELWKNVLALAGPPPLLMTFRQILYLTKSTMLATIKHGFRDRITSFPRPHRRCSPL